MRIILPLLLCLGFASAHGAETRQLSAAEYMAGAKAARPKGGVYIRARLVQGKTVMQIQIKRRNLSNGASDQLYQVIYPKERLGESLLLHITGSSFTGISFKPGGAPHKLTGADRRTGVFGTDLTIDDALADFFDWKHHVIIGHENAGPVPCAVIESKPDRAGSGPSKTVSWIDEKRYVPMRVQVFEGGDKPVRTVDTESVMRTSSGYYMPTKLTITSSATGAQTTVDGSSSKADVPYTDADFTEQAAQKVTPAPGGS